MPSTKIFKTLLLREWMQHRFGWSLMVLVPFALGVLAVLAGRIQLDGDETLPPPEALAVIAVLGLASITLALGWMAALFQAPGLARRDEQDRSIEFWLSLPTSHHQSLGATLLAHLVLWPCAALVCGVMGGLVLSLPLVTRMYGIGDWFALPWPMLLGVTVATTLRLLLGVALATVWLSPLLLLVMAASVWLKRWALPTVVASIAALGLVLDKAYHNPVVWNVLQFLGDNAGRALIASRRTEAESFTIGHRGAEVDVVLGALPGFLLNDAGHALANLAQPGMLGVLLVAAAGYSVLWFHRQRGT